MNTNQKGYIGLTRTVAELAEMGYEVFLPQHDYSAIDLIVVNEAGESRRVQVKYRETKDGVVTIPLNTVVNGKKIPINRDKIDGWAVYVPEAPDVMSRVLYIPKTVAGKSKSCFSVHLTGSSTRTIDALKWLDPARLFEGE